MMKTVLGLIFLFLGARGAFAGGWVSGGGEIIRDAENPWFLSNTQIVRYCISIGDPAFSDLPTAPDALVQKAISYWQQEFKRVDHSAPNFAGAGRLSIATQNFIQLPCSASGIDLKFQLGELTGEQQLYVGDASRVIGMAVRTDYDEIRMHGRGFIYISPDTGARSYNQVGLVPRAWHSGESGALLRVMIHELGHVFGLSHSIGVMARNFPEKILKPQSCSTSSDLKNGYDDLRTGTFFDYSPLTQAASIELCPTGNDGSNLYRFLGVENSSPCVGFDFTGDGRTIHLKKLSHEGYNPARLGTILVTNSRDVESAPAISVVLSPSQQVFDPNIQCLFNNLSGAPFLSHLMTGAFDAENGRHSQILLVSTPLGFSLYGLDQNGSFIDLLTGNYRNDW